jgi:small nuclear ribonucleoprotein (snRNP)-like protein
MLGVLTGFDNIHNITIKDIIEYNAFIGKNVYVIDVYRNPIERKISEYFEILANFHFNNIENNMNKYNLDLIMNRFNKIFPHIAEGDYFMEKYSINIPCEFDFNKKYLLVIKDNIKYVKLRLMDSIDWGKILSQILDTEIIIIKDYETQNKIIGNLYQSFKNNYKIPSNFLEEIQNCRYFNYYNSEEEKIRYLNNWNNKKTSSFKSFTEMEYILYREISTENQFYNFIQRNHYLDFGCICKSCFGKRKEIFNKIKRGIKNVNLKVIHQDIVAEKKIKKVKAITNICNNIQKLQIKNPTKNMGTDFTISGAITTR